jgi:signal transduction histidine kinase
MSKSHKKRSGNTLKQSSKNLVSIALDRIETEEKININAELNKAFQKFFNSDVQKKIEKYSDADRDKSLRTFLLLVISDLLEKSIQFQDELHQTTEAYEDVVALITHEFKNILTSVHGYNMMLEKNLEEGNDEQALALLRSSDRLTHQLFNMSDSLLKMSLEEKGLLNPEYKLINFIDDVLMPVEKDIKASVSEKNMNIIINKPPDDIIIEGDDDLLDIVIRNLLMNAVRYGKNGTDILVILERLKKECKLIVRNECENIPEDFCLNIFQKFTTKKTGGSKGGTGLGLYNVKKIIDLHKGTVRCDVKQDWIEFEIVLPQKIL